jgi:hypothetical protein
MYHDTSNMATEGDIDLENLEPPPSLLESMQPAMDGDSPTIKRQRTNVLYSKLDDETETTAPKPVDYTFRGRHIEMMAIGIELFSNRKTILT